MSPTMEAPGSESFPKFMELPRELRDLVWEQALFPEPDFSSTVRSAFHIRLRQRPDSISIASKKYGIPANPVFPYTITPSPTLASTTQPSRTLLSTCRESRHCALKSLPDVVRFPDTGKAFRFDRRQDQIVLMVADSEVLHEYRLSIFELSRAETTKLLSGMGLPTPIPRLGVMYESTLVSVVGDELHLPPKLRALARSAKNPDRIPDFKALPLHWRDTALRADGCDAGCDHAQRLKIFDEAIHMRLFPWIMALYGAMYDYDLNLGQEFDAADAQVVKFTCPGCGSEGRRGRASIRSGAGAEREGLEA